MEVDWVGDTLKVYDSASGCEIPAYIFVAVLPCSLYGYAEAELAEKLDRLSALNALLNMDEKGDNAIGMEDDTPDVKIADAVCGEIPCG